MTIHFSDWPNVILSQSFMRQMSSMAYKRFTKESLAEEAISFSLDALSLNNWGKLKDFSGSSKPSTYALSITARLYEDFSRKRFGRPRPPTWLQEHGQGWVTLWRMMCLERQWPESIINKLKTDYDLETLRGRMIEINSRLPNCGAAGFAECSISELGLDSGPDSADALSGSYFSMDQELNEHIKSNALTLLSNILEGGKTISSGCPSKETEVYKSACDALALSEEDSLLITLAYEDGLSSRKISELIGQSPSYVQRQLKNIRLSLATVLADLGADVSLLKQEIEHV